MATVERKQIQWYEFKSWTIQCAFYIQLMHLGEGMNPKIDLMMHAALAEEYIYIYIYRCVCVCVFVIVEYIRVRLSVWEKLSMMLMIKNNFLENEGFFLLTREHLQLSLICWYCLLNHKYEDYHFNLEKTDIIIKVQSKTQQ